MVDTTSTEELIRTALDEVMSSAKNDLSFATRRRLLMSFGPVGNELGKGALTPAHRMRARLAVASVKHVMSAWDARFSENIPLQLIERTEQCLITRSGVDILEKEAYQFRGALADAVPEDQIAASYVGRAAVCAAYVAIQDELLEPDDGVTPEELDDPQDPDLWDCASWAAAASAGDFPWGNARRFDADRNRKFWTWYLSDGIRSAT